MRTLVWKIFVSFWIVQALFFSMVAILYGTFRGQPPGLYAATGIVAFCERNAVQTYERSGSAALDAYLSDLQLFRDTDVYRRFPRKRTFDQTHP